MAGQADIIIAGGVETFSDVPIRFSRKVRQKLIGMPKAMKKGPIGGAQHFFKGLKMACETILGIGVTLYAMNKCNSCMPLFQKMLCC